MDCAGCVGDGVFGAEHSRDFGARVWEGRAEPGSGAAWCFVRTRGASASRIPTSPSSQRPYERVFLCRRRGDQAAARLRRGWGNGIVVDASSIYLRRVELEHHRGRGRGRLSSARLSERAPVVHSRVFRPGSVAVFCCDAGQGRDGPSPHTGVPG